MTIVTPRPRMRHGIVLIAVPIMVMLDGCGGLRLITDPPPVATRGTGNERNTVQVYERHFQFDASHKANVRTHSILRVGANGTEQYLAEPDGAMEPLVAYEARVIYADRTVATYGIEDLGTSTMSSSAVMVERSLRHVSLVRPPGPGDLIEEVSVHDLSLPQTGVMFSPAEAGEVVLEANCTIEVPRGDTVHTALINDTLDTTPTILRTPNSNVFRYTWNNYRAKERRNRFEQRNPAPTLLVAFPGHHPVSWKVLGDWYLGAIAGKLRPNEQITTTAQEIVKGLGSEREKMFAIARFCQANIRYEQVYLAYGEWIPNEASLILQHRYGDCKDYSTLMLVLARAAGLHPDLALCWRGTGRRISEDFPVCQFNHMIVHWRSNGEDFWFDGTNPPEAIGVADEDLINGKALVLAEGASHMATIAESPDNLCTVKGSFHAAGEDINGIMTVTLQGQYAVDFLATSHWANPGEMKKILGKWLESSIASNVTVAELRWRTDGTTFAIDALCRFPNALWHMGDVEYVRFDKIFNKVLPQPGEKLDPQTVFYYPGYARVNFDITLPDFASSTGGGECVWQYRSILPAGPFDESSRRDFIRRYTAEAEKTSHNLPLKRKG